MEIRRVNPSAVRFETAASESIGAPALDESLTPEPLSPGLPPDIADGLDLTRLLQDGMPAKQLQAAFRTIGPEYGVREPADEAMMRKALLAAQPYLQKLGDSPSESGVNDALETGVRIALLEEWLVRTKGLKHFPAALRAIRMEGRLPGNDNPKDDVVIIRG